VDPPCSLSVRFGALAAHATVTQAAILAADVSHAEGFRPTDVRFFFLLFTNWMEDDLLRPGLDVDLTQLRRALARLVEAGQATVGAGRAPRYRLSPAGVLRLVDGLVDPQVARTFEETVFLATIAASYRVLLAERVRGAPRSPGRRILTQLDPIRILRAERRRLDAVRQDLEARVEGGRRREAFVRAAPASTPPSRLAEQLRAEVGSYQLHPVRSLEALAASLPAPLARWELGPGSGLRARILFTPLLEQVRARLAILDRLEAAAAG
jgi:hypothetical protein